MAKVSSAREDLIDAAVELFRARGYEGVGVAELLEKSGAPRGSLYFHFPGGKEEIGVEAVKRVGEVVAGHPHRGRRQYRRDHAAVTVAGVRARHVDAGVGGAATAYPA